MIRADAASMHFAQVGNETDTKLVHYIYEVCEGRRFFMGPTSNALGQQALQRRQALFVPDRKLGRDAQHFRQLYPELYERGMRATAAIPIFFRDESEGLYQELDGDTREVEKNGLLCIGFAKQHFFTKDEVDWLEWFAGRAVEAIHYATNYTKTRDRARLLANIHGIARSLADDPASLSLLDEIAGTALNILAADLVSVYEYYQRENRFLFGRPTIAGRLIEPDLVMPVVDELSAPALLLRTRENIYADDVVSNAIVAAEPNSMSFVARERVKSAAAVILRGGALEDYENPQEEIFGLMYVNYRRRHRFTTEERRVIETLASSAAIAIRNRRIHRKTRERGCC
jgi:GAF domain-containing protein